MALDGLALLKNHTYTSQNVNFTIIRSKAILAFARVAFFMQTSCKCNEIEYVILISKMRLGSVMGL